MPETIVVHCPHCQHLLRLPVEYLGKVVSCLECTAPFRAPVKDGDGYTQPVPLARSRGVPVRLFVPLCGLLVLGVAGLILNAYLLSDRTAATAFARTTLESLFAKEPPEAKEWKEADGKKKPDQAELARREEISTAFRREQVKKLDRMAEDIPDSKPLRFFGLATSGLSLLGGLAFLIRRGYWLAFLGCLGCAVHSPDVGCCFVGVIVAVWGVLALVSDEGRRYFGIIDLKRK